MYRHRFFGAILALVLLVPGGVRAVGANADTVLAWNKLMQDTLSGPSSVLTPRFYALTHIAMFDAINAIERDFEPFHVRLEHAGGGSPDAAAAQAAHDVLVVLNPGAAATYDAALAGQLGPSPTGFVRHGAEIGAEVARQVLEWRQDDGWVVAAFPPYVAPPLPGWWQPTPPNNPAPQFTQLQTVEPLTLVSPTQFLPLPPPAITSARYATDFNEVKDLGRSTNSIRTAEQTSIARLWAGVATSGSGTATNMFAVWNAVVSNVVRERQLSLIRAARVLMLVNVSILDTLHTTQTSKYVYGFWRPVTAIRGAVDDLNPATDPDPAWLPLITTPPYPSYAGNMAAVGATASRALELLFQTNDVPVTATWHQSGGQPDVSHHFDGFSQMAEEQFMARIYGGIHYRFDQEAGQKAGWSVAEYVHANFANRRSHGDD